MHRNGRYRRIIRQCFEPATVGACEEFFRVRGSAYNQTAPHGQRVVQFDVQQRAWDFRAHPSDPDYGEQVDRLLISML